MEKGWNLGGRTHTRFIPEEAHFRDQEGVLLSKAHLEELGTSWASWAPSIVQLLGAGEKQGE